VRLCDWLRVCDKERVRDCVWLRVGVCEALCDWLCVGSWDPVRVCVWLADWLWVCERDCDCVRVCVWDELRESVCVWVLVEDGEAVSACERDCVDV
jgi:hypothetical protein